MQTKSQKEAAYQRQLRAEGWHRINVWLDPAEKEQLNRLIKSGAGSLSDIVRRGIELVEKERGQ